MASFHESYPNIMTRFITGDDSLVYEFKLQFPLRGHCFDTIKAINKNELKDLKAILSTTYELCTEDWDKYWQSSFAFDGSYIGETKQIYE